MHLHLVLTMHQSYDSPYLCCFHLFWLECKLTEGLYPIIHKRTMMTHCFLYAWGISLVTVEHFHTSVSSVRTPPNTGVVDFEIASLRLRFEKRLSQRSLALLYFSWLLSLHRNIIKTWPVTFKIVLKNHSLDAVLKLFSLDSIGLVKVENRSHKSLIFHIPWVNLQREAGSRLNLNFCHTGAVWQIHSLNL